MLKTFKHYAKQACLVFAILLFTVSCEKEEIFLQEETNPLIISNINNSQIKNNTALFKTLSILNKRLTKNKVNKNNKTSYLKEFDFLINTSIANHAKSEDNSYNSYTFAIERGEATNSVENIILSQEADGTYSTVLITYHTNAQQKIAFNSGVPVDLEGIKVEPRKIDPDFLTNSSSMSKRNGDEDSSEGSSEDGAGVVIAATWLDLVVWIQTGAGPGCYSIAEAENSTYVLTGIACGGGGSFPGGAGLPSGGDVFPTNSFPTGGGNNTPTGGGGTTNNPIVTAPVVGLKLIENTLLRELKSWLTTEQKDWLKTTQRQEKSALYIYLLTQQYSSSSKNITKKIIDILRGVSNTSILTTVDEHKAFLSIIGNSLTVLNGKLFPEHGIAFNDLDPNGVLNTDDWSSISSRIDPLYQTVVNINGIKDFIDINELSPEIRELIAKDSLYATFLSHVKSLVGDHWPQNRAEWEAVLTIMSQSMLEIGLAFVPGSGIIDAISSVDEGNYGMATFALATVVADFFGGTIIKVLAKIGKVAYKAFKIFRLAYSFIHSLSSTLNKGFKITLSALERLKLTKNKKVIAHGDDVGRVVGNIADAINDRQRVVINQHKNTIGNATNKRKGNFGEMASDLDMAEKGYIPLHTRIDNIDAAGHNGIDAVMEKNGQYFIVESKFSSTTTPSLNPANSTTGLPKQMSDLWIRRPGELSSVIGNNQILAQQILNSNYTRVLATHGPNGNKIYKLVNPNGTIGGTWIP